MITITITISTSYSLNQSNTVTISYNYIHGHTHTMRREDLINQKIAEEDDTTISTLFLPGSTPPIHTHLITPPFDTLLHLQCTHTNTFAHHRQMIECVRALSGRYVRVKRRVIGNIRHCTETTECARYLLVLFNENVCRAVVGNLMLLFYTRMGSVELMSNLVAVIDETGMLEDDRHRHRNRNDEMNGNDNSNRNGNRNSISNRNDISNSRNNNGNINISSRNISSRSGKTGDETVLWTYKDRLIFRSFKAVVLFKTGRFAECERVSRELLQHRAIRTTSFHNELLTIFSVSSFLNDRHVHCNDTEMHRMMVDTCKCRLSAIARHRDPLIAIHFHALAVRNLVRFCYVHYAHNHRLEMRWLRSAFAVNGVRDDAWLFMTMHVIVKGYVKGYISVNRDVVVFSRTEPFPGLTT